MGDEATDDLQVARARYAWRRRLQTACAHGQFSHVDRLLARYPTKPVPCEQCTVWPVTTHACSNSNSTSARELALFYIAACGIPASATMRHIISGDPQRCVYWGAISGALRARRMTLLRVICKKMLLNEYSMAHALPLLWRSPALMRNLLIFIESRTSCHDVVSYSLMLTSQGAPSRAARLSLAACPSLSHECRNMWGVDFRGAFFCPILPSALRTLRPLVRVFAFRLSRSPFHWPK